MRLVSTTLGLVATLTTAVLFAPAPADAAPPQMQPTDRPELEPTNPPVIKRFTKLATKNGAAVPGETRKVEATLTAGETPLAGKRVRFKLRGRDDGPSVDIDIGSSLTNAAGKATFDWKVPELAQAGYVLEAKYAGDDDTRAAADDANFAVFKALTKLDVDYSYGALDAHGGPHFGTLLIAVRRKSDNAALTKTVKVTINAGEATETIRDYTTTNGFVTVILPTATNTWKVKIQFFGDAANQGVQHEKTYSH